MEAIADEEVKQAIVITCVDRRAGSFTQLLPRARRLVLVDIRSEGLLKLGIEDGEVCAIFEELQHGGLQA